MRAVEHRHGAPCVWLGPAGPYTLQASAVCSKPAGSSVTPLPHLVTVLCIAAVGARWRWLVLVSQSPLCFCGGRGVGYGRCRQQQEQHETACLRPAGGTSLHGSHSAYNSSAACNLIQMHQDAC